MGRRIRRLRDDRGATLNELASASGVSRAMLSKIERGEASPTIGVAKRVAQALDTTLSVLTGGAAERRAVVVTRADQREAFRDPATGFERHLLSPVFAGSGIELVLHRLPAGASTGRLPAPPRGTEKHVVVLTGEVTVTIDEEIVTLAAGDTLFFEADVAHAFANSTTLPTEYYLFISRRAPIS